MAKLRSGEIHEVDVSINALRTGRHDLYLQNNMTLTSILSNGGAYKCSEKKYF